MAPATHSCVAAGGAPAVMAVTFRMILGAVCLVTAMIFPLTTNAASIKEIFEKYRLAGTWAADCGKPASRQNPHVVYRILDADRVQRETMIEPGKTFDVSITLSVVEPTAGELVMAWKTSEGGITNRVQVLQNQMQTMDSTRDNGEKLSVNGRRLRDNSETPRFKKCS
jgi:hypothetical protein